MSRVSMTTEQFDFMQQNRRGGYQPAKQSGAPAPPQGGNAFSREPKKFDKKKHDAKPENIVDAQIKSLLEAMGWIITRNHTGVFVPYRVAKAVPLIINGWDIIRMHPKGTPDRKAERILRGRPGLVERFWLELKAPGGKPSPEQRARLAEMKAMGEIAEWFDSFDDDFGDGHSFIPWYRQHFGRSPGDAPGVGI